MKVNSFNMIWWIILFCWNKIGVCNVNIVLMATDVFLWIWLVDMLILTLFLSHLFLVIIYLCDVIWFSLDRNKLFAYWIYMNIIEGWKMWQKDLMGKTGLSHSMRAIILLLEELLYTCVYKLKFVCVCLCG